MACCCISNYVPTYDVSSIAIDTTTGIATLTLNTTSISSGYFNMRFRCCGQTISPCWTETLNIATGSTTYANVIGRDGNYVRLGQTSRQINCCKILHCNLTTSPAGNIMILDKLPKCVFTGTVSNTPTVITVSN